MTKYSSLTDLGELIPRPDMIDDTIHEDGNTQDIIQTILMADGFKSHMAAREMKAVSAELIGENDYHTLMNVWNFVHDNIRYKADPRGHERIKSPSRLWYDREGDCKSFSLMIGSILRNYKTIGFSYRFVGYDRRLNDYTHVYVIAHMKNRPVVMDAVHTRFDEEVPYVLKKDYSMTQISHLHGISAPNYNRGARPSQAERFADAPRKAIRVPNIKDITRLTEGQLSLKLLSQSLEIDKAYYGMSKDIAEAEALIYRALNSGSGAITGYVDTELGKQIAQYVTSASKNLHAAIDPARMSSLHGINADPFTKEYCVEKFPYDAKKICYKKGFLGLGCTNWGPDPNDPAYKKYIDCINEKNAYWNIFNQPNYINGCHHMLYAYELRDSVPSSVNTKRIFHDFAINDWSLLTGMSKENVRIVTANGIKQTSASGKLPDISPEGSIGYISEAHKFSDPRIPKIGVVGVDDIAIIVSIIIAAGGFILKCIDQNSINRSRLQSNIGNNSFGPSEKDWIDELKANNMHIILGGAALAAGLLFIPSKKSKS